MLQNKLSYITETNTIHTQKLVQNSPVTHSSVIFIMLVLCWGFVW